MKGPGFNVVGYPNANSGLGVATRLVISLLERREIETAVFDLDLGVDLSGASPESAAPRIQAADIPHPINLMVIPITRVDLVWDRFESHSLRHARLNAALTFWELTTLPPRSRLPGLHRLDAVVAASDYMRGVLETSLSGPWIVPGRLACEVPSATKPERARFGIPDDAVAFVFSFEPLSDPERKNPCAVVDAFLRIADDVPLALLVINIKNSRVDGAEHEVVAALRARAGGHARVRLLTEELDYAAVMTLYASCDVYVSLHRAEGLGLGMMEAMALGKSVIATGWSGNMTFMDHASAALVRYELVPVEGTIAAYRSDRIEENTVWAEPDVTHAASWMRRLAEDPALLARMSAAAAERYRRTKSQADAGDFVDALATILEQSRGESRSAPKATDAQATPHVRETRLARIQELERQLDWITSRPSYRVAQWVKRLLKPGAQ
jgi:glycosyltransferase involved in cell wall biosynthesis